MQFQVLIGGTQGQNPHLPWHLPVLVRPEQVVDVTRSLLDLFREQGSREKRDAARFRYLIEHIGVGGRTGMARRAVAVSIASLRQRAGAPRRIRRTGRLVSPDSSRASGPWASAFRWDGCRGNSSMAWPWRPKNGAMDRCGPRPSKASRSSTFRPVSKMRRPPTSRRMGISPYADTLARNTVACTGKQFCNIAVTETKGHMLQLVEKLRARALTLHGIRIHMSGCPSSCAQHFTADIGLKGVRVRRLLGTREGFDVYLGGGIAGQVHLALLYKLGVDVDQLPQLIEDVVQEYYLRHKPGTDVQRLLAGRIARHCGGEGRGRRIRSAHLAVRGVPVPASGRGPAGLLPKVCGAAAEFRATGRGPGRGRSQAAVARRTAERWIHVCRRGIAINRWRRGWLSKWRERNTPYFVSTAGSTPSTIPVRTKGLRSPREKSSTASSPVPGTAGRSSLHRLQHQSRRERREELPDEDRRGTNFHSHGTGFCG